MKSICIIAYTNYMTDARVIRHAESAYQAGYAVDVVTPGGGGREDTAVLNGVVIHQLRTRYYRGSEKKRYVLSYIDFFLRCLVRVSRLHIKNRYRVIQVCNMPDFLVFSAVIPKLSGARIILDIHDPMPHVYMAKFPGSRRQRLHRLLLLLERLSAAFSDRVMTVNEPVRTDILLKDGIPAAKVSVVANFADDRIFKARKDYEIRLPVRMIYYGTISARFGFDGVLSAIQMVRGKHRMFLRIIGNGDGEAALRERITALALENIVEFDNRSYPLWQMPDILARHHLGVVPYSPSPATDYMLPVKLMEMLAMGMPAITIPNTAIRHYIDENIYFAYDPRNMETLTQLIERILDDPSLILEKREAVLKEAEKYQWKKERRKYLDLLTQLST